MRTLALLLLFTSPLLAQRSTLCQTAVVPVDATHDALQLLGCGDGFPDNLLWHLDRSDSVTGVLDGKVRFDATGRGAVIYVIDQGILRDHREFTRAGGSNVIAGIRVPRTNWGGGCDDPVLAPCGLEVSHGTWVASVAAGSNVGTAPDASLVAVYSHIGYSPLEEAFRLIAEHANAPTTPSFHTAIINISGGGPDKERAQLYAPMLRKYAEGVDANGDADPNGRKFLVVVAAGNASPPGQGPFACDAAGNVAGYPAGAGAFVDGTITVGAVTRENLMWEGSCRGSLVELLAPGADVLVPSVEGNDLYMAETVSGTSFAAPYVAGMAARLLEKDPTLTPAQLEAALKASPSRVDGIPVAIAVPPSPRRRAVRH